MIFKTHFDCTILFLTCTHIHPECTQKFFSSSVRGTWYRYGDKGSWPAIHSFHLFSVWRQPTTYWYTFSWPVSIGLQSSVKNFQQQISWWFTGLWLVCSWAGFRLMQIDNSRIPFLWKCQATVASEMSANLFLDHSHWSPTLPKNQLSWSSFMFVNMFF